MHAILKLILHAQVGQNAPATAVVPCLEKIVPMVDGLSLQTQVQLVILIIAEFHLGVPGIVNIGSPAFNGTEPSLMLLATPVHFVL